MTEQEKKRYLTDAEKEFLEWDRKCKRYNYLLKTALRERERLKKEIKNLKNLVDKL